MTAPSKRMKGVGAVLAAAAVLLALVVGTPTAAAAADPPIGTVTRFPSGTALPIGITQGPDGNMWVTFGTDQIGKVTPDGAITYFALPTGTWPGMITAGPDGNLWFVTMKGSIGRITPLGVVTLFPAVEPAPDMALWDIVAGPDGALWFTSPVHDAIGRITTAGVVETFALPELSNPRGITVGPSGDLWFSAVGQGTMEHPPMIGRISLSGAVTWPSRPPLLNAGLLLANDITLGSDGNLWVADYFGLVRITPDGAATKFSMPLSKMAQQVAPGPDGNLWFTIRNSNQVGRMTPGGAVTLFPAEPDATPTSDVINGVSAGPDGTVWFVNLHIHDPGASDPNVGTVSRVLSGSLPTCSTAPFVDVSVSHAFCGQIQWLVDQGIATGFPDDTFRPSEIVSRQGVAAFLYRLAGSPNGEDPTCTEAPFLDVPVDHPFCGEIAWAKAEGIVAGYAGEMFLPGGQVSRQATAAFLYRFAGEPNGADPMCDDAPFTDVSSTYWLCGEIDWMTQAGITNGYPDGSFGPFDPVSRQAMAAFLYRFDQLDLR